MKYILLVLLSLAPAFARPFQIDEAWKPVSDPLIMEGQIQRQWSALPLQARVRDRQKYWSGDYWPLSKGLINLRWYSRAPVGFNLVSPTRQMTLTMNEVQLAQLAPTEKFDILFGRFNYPLKNEVALKANPYAQSWEGICHGWGPASINHVEPKAVVLTNPDGLRIFFGSSDVKALLSYAYSLPETDGNLHFMGQRCNGGYETFECDQDLNAGAFHLVIANRIGMRGVGFIADLVRSGNVYNHPVIGYTSTVQAYYKPGRTVAPGTTRVVRVKTVVDYVSETSNWWDGVIGTGLQREHKKMYEYNLELNRNGEIIGGEWKSAERPDFMWYKNRIEHFSGNLQGLEVLLQ